MQKIPKTVTPNSTFMKNGFAAWYCENSSQDLPYPEHNHSGCSDLYYVASGKLINLIKGKEYVNPEGDIVWIRENDKHMMWGSGNLKFYQINFAPKMAEGFATLLGKKKQYQKLIKMQSPPFFHVPKHKRPEMVNMFKNLLHVQYKPESELEMSKALMTLLSDYLLAEKHSPEDVDSRPDANMPPWLLSALDKLDKDIENKIDISNLSDICGRSPEHIARSFKKYLRITPSKYIKKKRISRASSILLSTDRKILDIAYSSGFESIGYFYRLFKEEFNCSPADYKRKYYSAQTAPK